MALIPTQQVNLAADLNPTLQAAQAGGDTFQPGETVWLQIQNTSGASITATVDSVAPSSYGDDVNVAIVVPAGGTRLRGPFRAQRFAGAGGLASVAYSAAAGVNVGAFVI